MDGELSVKSSIVKVLGIPTKIFTIGSDVEDRPKEVILVIPGIYLHFKLPFNNVVAILLNE